MIVKVDGVERKDFRSDNQSFLKFLKENTHSGVVAPQVEVFKSVDVAKDTFHWILSTSDVDRDFEVIDQKGWDLKNFIANPVMLWSHNYQIPPIGYLKNIFTEPTLESDLVFNDKEFDEFGWSIGQRVKAGALHCGSVGFIAKEIEFLESKDRKCDLIYRKQELLEFSICAVPANPFALNTDKKTMGQEDAFKKAASFYDRVRAGLARA